jgi:hypothetical protein
MTPEERIRMNQLCVSIQEEKDYENFTAMLREMSELIERKEQRRFPYQPKILWARNKPWVSVPATATKVLPSMDGPKRMVEISIPAADVLFREIRIENQFTGVVGQPVSVSAGARLTLTIEAEASETVPDTQHGS